jgi:hypothetical protein
LLADKGSTIMSERAITQLFGLFLGGVFTSCLVLSAVAAY